MPTSGAVEKDHKPVPDPANPSVCVLCRGAIYEIGGLQFFHCKPSPLPNTLSPQEEPRNVLNFLSFAYSKRCEKCKAHEPILVNSAGYYSHSEEGNYCNNHWLYKAYEVWADPINSPVAAPKVVDSKEGQECTCEAEFPEHCGPECDCYHHNADRWEHIRPAADASAAHWKLFAYALEEAFDASPKVEEQDGEQLPERPVSHASMGLLDTLYSKKAEAYINALEARLAAMRETKAKSVDSLSPEEPTRENDKPPTHWMEAGGRSQ